MSSHCSWLFSAALMPLPSGPCRELALLRDLQHRVPVDRRVVFRRRGGVRRDDRLEVEDLSGRRLHLRRVDEAVAAHPHAVGGFREIGNEVAPAVVGDHDLGELRGQVGRLRDHPHARFRAVRAGHDAAEIGGADADRGISALLRARRSLKRDGEKTMPRPTIRACRSAACSYAPSCRHDALLRRAGRDRDVRWIWGIVAGAPSALVHHVG